MEQTLYNLLEEPPKGQMSHRLYKVVLMGPPPPNYFKGEMETKTVGENEFKQIRLWTELKGQLGFLKSGHIEDTVRIQEIVEELEELAYSRGEKDEADTHAGPEY